MHKLSKINLNVIISQVLAWFLLKNSLVLAKSISHKNCGPDIFVLGIRQAPLDIARYQTDSGIQSKE